MGGAKLLYGATDLGASQFSSDILWRTGFRVPDPVFLVEINKVRTLFVSALEFGRARHEASADYVVSNHHGIQDVLRFLKKNGVGEVVLPRDFPYGLAKTIGEELRIVVKDPPFYPERLRKTRWEIGEIRAAQEAACAALKKAMEFLQSSRIRGRHIYDGKRAVTSQALRRIIDDLLYADGYLGINTIVSSGRQSADPHAVGSGLLIARSPIVIDIFPVSLRTHYYGDMTRTVFKSEPSKEYGRMYEAVRHAQERAIARIKAGVDASRLYRDTLKFFESHGYPTRLSAGSPEGFTPTPIARKRSRARSRARDSVRGFIHGLGHGVGIDIHEPPSLGAKSCKLEAGNVVTVEPGLYYGYTRCTGRGMVPAGGIRIEDTVVVQKMSCQNLINFPKDLASVIL